MNSKLYLSGKEKKKLISNTGKKKESLFLYDSERGHFSEERSSNFASVNEEGSNSLTNALSTFPLNDAMQHGLPPFVSLRTEKAGETRSLSRQTRRHPRSEADKSGRRQEHRPLIKWEPSSVVGDCHAKLIEMSRAGGGEQTLGGGGASSETQELRSSLVPMAIRDHTRR